MATFRVKKLHSSAQAPKRAETNTHGPLKLEQHKARDPKLAKTADASDVSQTSQHDNGNCHYRHPGYHMNYSGYLTKEFYVVDVQDGAVSVPSPFLSITCLSKSFYDLDAWALTHLTFAVPSSIDGLSSLFLSWCFSTNHASHTSLFILSILCVYLFIL